ncbi:signal peptidase I [Fictibacillus sp. 7GRE50]|uniref:signal peptidase I n=1 Tax=Fictibacillus sp. 7GRE50 TaxID=2745878 RepID=UPI0018CF545F|nr:signal peptidase I [Fictibacillus sp. 7GRE50]MBH0164250.1 signal peptidase I [Fictibacillus sp. 7GRE50]
MVKKALSILGSVLFGLLITLVGFSVYLTISAKANPNEIPSVLGFKPLTVLSNSMYPELEAGDMIFARELDPTEVKRGNVITFKENDGRIVTHRVVKVISEKGETTFQTKGDNNNVVDQELVSSSQLLGMMGFNVPNAGHVAKFAASPIGAFVFFGVPFFFYVLLEMNDFLKRRKRDKEQMA